MSESQLVTVTDSAAKRIAALIQQDGGDVALRVAVNGGGCSGFRYDLTFDDKRQDDDLVIEKDGAVVLVDTMSQQIVRDDGGTIVPSAPPAHTTPMASFRS